MKSKLISIVLVMSLVMTSAVCAYASNNMSKNHPGKDIVTKTIEDQSNSDRAAKREMITQKREQVRSGYSAKELDAVNEAAEKIKKEDPDARVLDVDSIISDDAEFKFDTPPVIKGGRTLIPVRAITEGFGAELTYDKESQQVTITKGDTVIELTLGSMTAVVNGQEVLMDTKAGITNSRTYVPLRFVLETFKLTVEWDDDTDTVEIDDDSDNTESDDTTTDDISTGDQTTTPDAITVTE